MFVLEYLVPNFDKLNKDELLEEIKKLEDRQFSAQDAAAYLLSSEEINPDLDEDYALSKMSKISSKYPLKTKSKY